MPKRKFDDRGLADMPSKLTTLDRKKRQNPDLYAQVQATIEHNRQFLAQVGKGTGIEWRKPEDYMFIFVREDVVQFGFAHRQETWAEQTRKGLVAEDFADNLRQMAAEKPYYIACQVVLVAPTITPFFCNDRKNLTDLEKKLPENMRIITEPNYMAESIIKHFTDQADKVIVTAIRDAMRKWAKPQHCWFSDWKILCWSEEGGGGGSAAE